jgi:hypothetical protein
VGLLLSGCATNATFVAPNTEVQKLAGENKGVVLLHTSLHDEPCHTIKAMLAKPDTFGRYAEAEWINVKFVTNRPKEPSQIALVAGDYGFVEFECQGGQKRVYAARIVQLGNPLDRSGSVYERPIATFNVQAGEVVDIGSLQLAARRVGAYGWQTSAFSAVVTPMPELWLQNLAAGKPNLHSARVTRLMKVPPPGPPQNDPTAAADAR